MYRFYKYMLKQFGQTRTKLGRNGGFTKNGLIVKWIVIKVKARKQVIMQMSRSNFAKEAEV